MTRRLKSIGSLFSKLSRNLSPTRFLSKAQACKTHHQNCTFSQSLATRATYRRIQVYLVPLYRVMILRRVQSGSLLEKIQLSRTKIHKNHLYVSVAAFKRKKKATFCLWAQEANAWKRLCLIFWRKKKFLSSLELKDPSKLGRYKKCLEHTDTPNDYIF